MPSRWWYALAAVLLSISVPGYTVADLSFLQRWPQAMQEFSDHIAAMCRVAAVPGATEIVLQEPGEYFVFLEGLTDEQKEHSDPPGLDVVLETPAGERVPMDSVWRRSSYSLVYSGISVWSFQIAEPGPYKVVVGDPVGSAEAHWVLAFGKDLKTKILQLLAAAAWPLVWITGIAAAVVIAAVTYFKRRDTAVPVAAGDRDPR